MTRLPDRSFLARLFATAGVALLVAANPDFLAAGDCSLKVTQQTGYSAAGLGIAGARRVRLSATLGSGGLDRPAGKGTLTLDPNRYEHDVPRFRWEQSTSEPEQSIPVTLEPLQPPVALGLSEKDPSYWEVKGKGLGCRLFLVVPPGGKGVYQLIRADDKGKAKDVFLMEPAQESGQ